MRVPEFYVNYKLNMLARELLHPEGEWTKLENTTPEIDGLMRQMAARGIVQVGEVEGEDFVVYRHPQ